LIESGPRRLPPKESRLSGDARAVLREFIGRNFLLGDEAALKDGDSLMGQGIVDSTGILEVVGFIEETFGFKIADEEILPENLDSIDSLSAFIGRKSV
jgi:acyl carrier protein